MSHPNVPSGVALLAQLEGEANSRGSLKEFIPSTSERFDWSAFENCIYDAISNGDGELHWKNLQYYLKRHGYVVFEWDQSTTKKENHQ